MKFEKVLLILSVTAVAVAITHEGVAATSKNTINQKTVKKTAKKTAKKTTQKKLSRQEIEDQAIEKEIRAFELAAVTPQPVRSEKLIKNLNNTQSRTSLKEVKSAAPDTFTGNVDFIVGSDSNIDVDRSNQYKGTFYQIDPTVGYSSGRWSGSFGASIKDYADPVHSELFRTTEAKAGIKYGTDLSTLTKSTTTFDFLYHDERWPDYIDGTTDVNGNAVSMPIRYSDIKISQTLDFNFGAFKTQIGGSAKHRDNYNDYSDNANELFGAFQHQRDLNELALFGRLGLQAASFLELAIRPTVKQTKYQERKARLPFGDVGGEMVDAPLYELITTEANFDLVFKIGDSQITPTALIGQTSDEGMGAEDQAFYGFGISTNLVIDKTTSLVLTPNASYKKINYDNWTKDVVPANEKRIEDETSAGITASIKLAKNLGIMVGYNVVQENSNMEEDTSENYRQEVVTSGLNFSF